MPDGRERAGEILHGPDGERLYLLLVEYAHKLAMRYGWRTGKTLLQGASPRTVAHEAIAKVLSGQRTWDESREPSLLNVLKGIVKSELGHLYSGFEAGHVEPIDQTLPDGMERTAESFGSQELNPQELLLKNEQTRLEMTALALILKEAEGNTELESVFLALYETGSSREISRLTGIPVERVYTLRRELERIAAKITPERVFRAAQEEKRRRS